MITFSEGFEKMFSFSRVFHGVFALFAIGKLITVPATSFVDYFGGLRVCSSNHCVEREISCVESSGI